MIKIYKNSKLFLEYPEFKIKNLHHIKLIFCDLGIKKLIEKVEVPEMCEEPYQYIMRANGFILQSY